MNKKQFKSKYTKPMLAQKLANISKIIEEDLPNTFNFEDDDVCEDGLDIVNAIRSQLDLPDLLTSKHEILLTVPTGTIDFELEDLEIIVKGKKVDFPASWQ